MYQDLKYFSKIFLPIEVCLDELFMRTFSAHSLSPFFQNDRINSAKGPQNEKRCNAFFSQNIVKRNVTIPFQSL
jgi:hypothetical protein